MAPETTAATQAQQGTPEAEQPAVPRDQLIRRAATELFMEKGYAATSMRELARAVGIEAASLYNHLPSKQELLATMLLSTMEELVDAVRSAVVAPDDPTEQLRAATIAYVMFHQDHMREAAITDSERRSLTPEHAERLLHLRDQLAAVFREVLARGAQTGEFDIQDVHLEAVFILSICARLPVWYRDGGRLPLDVIGRLIADFAVAAVACPRNGGPGSTEFGGR